MRHAIVFLLLLLSVALPGGNAFHPALTRKGVLLWQVQLSPEQCGSAAKNAPCYNVYAVNETHGNLVWFAFTTSSAAVKGMFLGRHSVYYTTWTGPGLYAVNPTNGHVRWQFPLDKWFAYWMKDIDLDHSASFGTSAEVRELVYVTAAGPPARVYGVRTKSGSKQWEYKLPQPSAVLADLTGPLESSSRGGGSQHATAFMAVNLATDNSSWVQAFSTASGRVAWQSPVLNSTTFDRVELQEQDGVVLATTAGADSISAFDAYNGSLLWTRAGNFCSTPSPIAHACKGRLLLPHSCDSMARLTAVDVVSGKELWDGPWSVPNAAEPLGNCSSHSQADGSILFGCSCYSKARWHWEGSDSSASKAPASSSKVAAAPSSTTTHQRGASSAAAAADGSSSSSSSNSDSSASLLAPHTANAVCLYALNSHNGRLRWVVPLVGNATFPEGAQRWGHAPLIHQDLAVFLATDRVLAVDLESGKLRWSLQLPRSEVLQAFELPVIDSDSGTLLLSAKVQGGNKTGLSGVSLREGRLLWHKTLNGSVQVGQQQRQQQQPGDDGPQELVVSGGRVYVEACRGSRCCLRALNVTTGRQRWGMCLDAVQGDDATHPHAQFAIWFITLVTIVSIALLILGAALVYIQRWSEERRILYGTAAPPSPRHSYQPLPPRASDSDDG